MNPPSSSGTYILFVELSAPASIEVGRLGGLSFGAGFYAYVGSAFGPGGLSARLRRYAVGPGSKHWHIDYLLDHAEVVGALFSAEDNRRECAWAHWVEVRARASVPGFGSSDCLCACHLLLVGRKGEADMLIRTACDELNATYVDRQHLTAEIVQNRPQGEPR